MDMASGKLMDWQQDELWSVQPEQVSSMPAISCSPQSSLCTSLDPGESVDMRCRVQSSTEIWILPPCMTAITLRLASTRIPTSTCHSEIPYRSPQDTAASPSKGVKLRTTCAAVGQAKMQLALLAVAARTPADA